MRFLATVGLACTGRLLNKAACAFLITAPAKRTAPPGDPLLDLGFVFGDGRFDDLVRLGLLGKFTQALLFKNLIEVIDDRFGLLFHCPLSLRSNLVHEFHVACDFSIYTQGRLDALGKDESRTGDGNALPKESTIWCSATLQLTVQNEDQGALNRDNVGLINADAGQ